MEQTREPLLLSITDAASRIAVSRMTLLRLVHDGELQTIRIGRAVRVPTASVAAFVARKMEEERNA